jgi:hypothetical protein
MSTLLSLTKHSKKILDLADFRLEVYGVLVEKNNLDAFRSVQICGVLLTLLYLPHSRVL